MHLYTILYCKVNENDNFYIYYSCCWFYHGYMEKKAYYLGFSLFHGIGPKRFAKLLQTFGSAKDAWNADERSLQKILGELIGQHFVQFRETYSFEKTSKILKEKQITALTENDKEYPSLLQQTSSHPYLIFVKGNRKILNFPQAIGIVGTRKITPYGKQVTEALTHELVAAGFVTVSGLAMGVDATAHMATIDAGGKTIAVLGCGVDTCYPRENQRVYDSILENYGAIVSTFPPGMQANRGTFPARNAIIAGLSLGIVVTEGAADSGALITARDAKKINRPVFAVPGPITSGLSRGPNILLQDGALLVTSGEDIVKKIQFPSSKQREVRIPSTGSGLHSSRPAMPAGRQARTINNLSPEEQKILDMIQLYPLHFDEIVRTIGKSAGEVGTILSVMELKGLVKNSGSIYTINF